jgi:hypothetical protein
MKAEQTTPEHFPIWVVRKELSDASEVFDVEIGGQTVEAVTKDDAYELAQKISEAINEHSNTDSAVLDA